MRFPRQHRIFKGQFEAAPYLGVFFLLVLFLLLGSSLVFLPGVSIQLPAGDGLPGAAQPVAVVAVDEGGTFYYENQRCDEARLRERLRASVARSAEPLTLVARVDQGARAEAFLRLAQVARDVGIRTLLQEVRPGSGAAAAGTAPAP
ncbi:MAG: hypothetical protein RJA22_3221 [Verrucomicrobiota bacterium]|jgi:biopolymer transport protein ExbD